LIPELAFETISAAKHGIKKGKSLVVPLLNPSEEL